MWFAQLDQNILLVDSVNSVEQFFDNFWSQLDPTILLRILSFILFDNSEIKKYSLI